MSIGRPLEGLGAGDFPGEHPGTRRKEKSRKLGKSHVSKKGKSEKKKTKMERVAENMQALSLSSEKPKKSVKKATITDPALKAMLQRNIPEMRPLSTRPGTEGEYQNPLQQAQYERACIESLQELLDRLRQTSSDARNLFMKQIYSRVATLVSGIPQSYSVSRLGQDEKTGFVKELHEAASDLWRTCDKYVLVREDENGDRLLLQDVHPLAYDAQEATPVQELNARFLQFLREGLEHMGHDAKWLPTPDEVDWETPEEVAAWVKDNKERIQADRELCRLLRSAAQDRYTGYVGAQFLLSVYGPSVETNAPISSRLDLRAMQFKRIFHPNKTHTEMMHIPVRINYRGEERELAKVDWVLEIDYDAQCMPRQVRSSATIRAE